MAEVPIGRLSGTFRGAAETDPPGVSQSAEEARLFRSPLFGGPPGRVFNLRRRACGAKRCPAVGLNAKKRERERGRPFSRSFVSTS